MTVSNTLYFFWLLVIKSLFINMIFLKDAAACRLGADNKRHMAKNNPEIIGMIKPSPNKDP